MKVRDVVSSLEARAPSSTAEGWDNVGLLVGDPEARVDGAVVSIDLTEEALELALRKKLKLVVNHHPCIFPRSKGLSRLRADGEGTQSLVYRAAREGIAVFSTHTNFDRCALEAPRAAAKALGLEPRGRLHGDEEGALTKLSVFVPETHAERVREAVCAAGAGQVGDYDQCSFGAPGEGTFRGGPGSKPFLGQSGRIERAREVRLETVFPSGLRGQVLAGLREAHPYEEIAYDLYPLLQAPPSAGLVSGLGYGFWGDYAKPRLFSEVIKDVKRVFRIDRFLLTGSPAPKRIQRIGFVAGKGAGFVGSAASARCDLFVTGEAGYHVALGASRQGLPVMELGHRESERFFLGTLSGWLSQCGLKSIILDEPTQKII
jgi:dinuclear metal center YbgI/SA1388 family protein